MNQPAESPAPSSSGVIWPEGPTTSDGASGTEDSPSADGQKRTRTVLALERDSRRAGRLVRRLEQAGFVIHLVRTLTEVRAAVTARRYDCLILDRVVPDGDALELVEELHARRNRPPTLILSGLGDAEDRVKALRLGADECLVKPVGSEEILLRVEALLARHSMARGWVAVSGSVVFDRFRHLITIDGEETHLTPRQYAVFNYLMVNSHRVVGAEELLEHCWDMGSTGDPIHTQINNLRKRFQGHLKVKIVHGFGYILQAEGVDDDTDGHTSGGGNDGNDGDGGGGNGGGGPGGKNPKDNSHIGGSGDPAGAGGGHER